MEENVNDKIDVKEESSEKKVRYTKKEIQTIMNKIIKGYLKGRLVWDSRRGPYVKSKHGPLV